MVITRDHESYVRRCASPLIMEHPHDNTQSATPDVVSGLSSQTLLLASLGAAVIFMACRSA